MSGFPKNFKDDTLSEVNNATAKDAPWKLRCHTKKVEGSKTMYDSSTRTFMVSNSSWPRRIRDVFRKIQTSPSDYGSDANEFPFDYVMFIFQRNLEKLYAIWNVLFHKEVNLCTFPSF